jgi:RNA polymerase sigma factor (sigma-70 family)
VNVQHLQLHLAALELEQRVIADLHLDLSPRRRSVPRESTRAPGYMRARQVVRAHPAAWALWQRAEVLRWQLALTQQHQIRSRTRGLGEAAEDIASTALESLFIAAITWSPSRASFATHASYWVRAGVQRAIDRAPVVRPSGRLSDVRRDLRLRGTVGTPVSRITVDAARGFKMVSLSAPAPDGKGYFGDLLPGDSPAVDVVAADNELAEELHLALDLLAARQPRDHAIIRRRFGLDDGEERTLLEVGAEHGVSRERARIIERQGLEALRSMLGAQPRPASPYAARGAA